MVSVQKLQAVEQLANNARDYLDAGVAVSDIENGLISGGFDKAQATAFVRLIDSLRIKSQAQGAMRYFRWGMTALAVGSLISLATQIFSDLIVLYLFSWLAIAVGVLLVVRALRDGLPGNVVFNRATILSVIALIAIVLVGVSNIVSFIIQ